MNVSIITGDFLRIIFSMFQAELSGSCGLVPNGLKHTKNASYRLSAYLMDGPCDWSRFSAGLVNG